MRIFPCAIALTTLCSAAFAIELHLPVDCKLGESCAIQHYVDRDPGAGSKDYRCGTLTYDKHNGTDFRIPSSALARKGVEVRAAAAGRVLRVRNDAADGLFQAGGKEAVQGSECGNGAVLAHEGGYETQYCHLAKGSVLARPGQSVEAGSAIGRIGLSGQTEFPHLHFTVRKDGQVVDPFAPSEPADGSCGGGVALWAKNIPGMEYRPGTVLNAGFAASTLDRQQLENQDYRTPDSNADVLVAFVRAIGLRAGDVQKLQLTAPDGQTLAEKTAEPLPRHRAEQLMFIGRKRPQDGWKRGLYKGRYTILREGKAVLERAFEIAL
jgi:hypothetical protein